MTKMTNSKILSLLLLRDGTSCFKRDSIRLALAMDQYRFGVWLNRKKLPDFEVDSEVMELVHNLEDEDYCLNDDDLKLLRKQNVLVYDEEDSSLEVFHNFIIGSLYDNGPLTFNKVVNSIPSQMTAEECVDIICDYEGKYGFTYNSVDVNDIYIMYKKTFVFDYLLSSLMLRERDIEYGKKFAAGLVNGYLFGDSVHEDIQGNIKYFTSKGDIRFFAQVLGSDNMKDVLVAHNCDNVGQYVELKFGKGQDVKKLTYK